MFIDVFIRSISKKMDIILQRDHAGMRDPRAAGDANAAVPSNLVTELTQIRTTESNILHQLADLRSERGISSGISLIQTHWDCRECPKCSVLNAERVLNAVS